jgi:hypothetical protein
MEDMRSTIMNEVNDVKRLVGSRPITNEMGTDPQGMPQLTDAPTTMFDVPPIVSQEKTETPIANMMRRNSLFEDDEIPLSATTPVKSRVKEIENMQGASTSQKILLGSAKKKKEDFDDMDIPELQRVYYGMIPPVRGARKQNRKELLDLIMKELDKKK